MDGGQTDVSIARTSHCLSARTLFSSWMFTVKDEMWKTTWYKLRTSHGLVLIKEVLALPPEVKPGLLYAALMRCLLDSTVPH
jgi:hypothetical protein